MNDFINRFKPFLKQIAVIAFPIILQQFFFNIASLLDTLMVGQLNEASVSGVYIATQIVFIINLMIFGATEGGSVFFSQYYGINDIDKMKKCFIFKIVFSISFALISIAIIMVFAPNLVNLFVEEGEAYYIAIKYLKILTISFVPYAITSSISTSLREIHLPKIPMIVAISGAFFNFILNYTLIFGLLFIPSIGATGAAIGTVCERIFEVSVLVIYLYRKKFSFTNNLFKNINIDKELLSNLFFKSIPLVFNEILFAFGQTTIIYIFSQNNAMATIALPIASTIYNLLYVVCIGIGNSITILLGNSLGQNSFSESQDKAKMSLLTSLLAGIILGIILMIIAPFVASLYQGVSLEGRNMGEVLIRLYGIYIIICSQTMACFFVIRSGGKTLIVFLFDSGYTWLIQIPIAFILLYTTSFSFPVFLSLVYGLDIIKALIGYVLIFSKKWIKSLTY